MVLKAITAQRIYDFDQNDIIYSYALNALIKIILKHFQIKNKTQLNFPLFINSKEDKSESYYFQNYFN